MSAMKTPFLPQTVPTSFSQQSVASSSMPTPTAIRSSLRTGMSLPSLPLRSKWVSIWKVSTKPKPWILAPFSLYCRQSVPFLTSSSPLPLVMEFGARPARLLKQRMPKEEPPPQEMADWMAVPAETPMMTTSLLRTRRLMRAKMGLGVPSSLSQQRAWRDWSPPLKQMISASQRQLQCFSPRQVRGSVAVWQLSTCTLMCLGAMPSPSKKGPVAASSSPSPMQYSSSPQAESGQAEVMTATLGQSVPSQFWLQFGRTGFPTTWMSFWQAGLLSLRRTLPKRKSLTGEAVTNSRAQMKQIFIINYPPSIIQHHLLIAPSFLRSIGMVHSNQKADDDAIYVFLLRQSILSRAVFKIYLRISHYNIQMSLLGVNPNTNDDYKNDIKPDGSVPAFTDSFSSISWAPSLPQVFAATAWNGELRVFEVTSSGYGNAIVQKMSFSFQQPALKCAWNDQSTQIYVGLMDGCIKVFDIGSGQAADVGRHSAAISSLHFVPGMNTVVSSGYESNVQFWQLGNPNPVMTFNAENKIYTSDFQFPMLVAGTANEKIMIVDINNASSRTLVDSNDLGKFSQIQSIAINQKCTMFGVASFDGRANLSSLIKNVNGMFAPKSVITFKSNKQEQAGNTILYPINSVSFNPINDRWFMTAGSDGGMHFWDYEAKNKIKSLNYGGIPICTAKVSPTGNMVAYGLGNDWHLGAEGSKWQPKLGVHLITENETKFAK